MKTDQENYGEKLLMALNELQVQANLTNKQILVIGTSTSEVIGEHIGTSGSSEVSHQLYAAFNKFQRETGVALAFQCCEHLNRALVVERKTAEEKQLEIVSVVPVKAAGGSMAAYAYQQLEDPVVVEFIKADAGIDIGSTLIGMHLKHVAVPVRTTVKEIGQAHVTLAKTRPKLIGGDRAVYVNKQENKSCS